MKDNLNEKSFSNGKSLKDEEKSLKEILMELDVSDKEKLKEKLREIIAIRLENEIAIGQGIILGVNTDNISIEQAAMLLNKGKDSLTDLIKIVELLEGNDTDRAGVSIRIRDQIAQEVRRGIIGDN